MTIEELVDLEMREKTYASEIIKPDLTEDWLSHHGILGMHWGQRNGPPYPLGSDVSTGHRLKSGGAGSVEKKKPKKKTFAEKRKAKKVYKKRVAAAQKARETKAAKAAEAQAKAAEEERKAKEAQDAQDRAEKEAMEKEIWRQNVISKGDIMSAKEHTDLFSTDEVNQIINKYNADQRLSQLVSDATPSTPEEKTRLEKMEERVDKIQRFAGTVSKLADSASKVYNAYNTVNDILNSGNKKSEAANKANAEAAAKREEDWKKRIIATRDISTALANTSKFNSNEIDSILNNMDADTRLKEAADIIKSGQDYRKPKGGNDKKDGDNKGSNDSNKKQSNETNTQQSSQTQQPKQEAQPSKSVEPQQSPYVKPPDATQNKPNLSPSLMDRVMARAQNAVSEQRSTNQRTRHDKAYYEYQSSQALELMKANLEEDGGPVSQINMIDDILKDRRRRGKYD